MRTRVLSVVAFLFFVVVNAAWAVEARQVVTSDNTDYFGFDLRSEQNVTLDQCKTS